MRRFSHLAVFLLVLIGHSGCGGPAESEARLDFGNFVVLYDNLTIIRGPLRDLAAFETLANQMQPVPPELPRIVERIRSGEYVAVWRIPLSTGEGLPDHSEIVLIFERDAPSGKGLVGFADRSIKLMTPEDFKAVLERTKSLQTVSPD
jgi:hypothetical protein